MKTKQKSRYVSQKEINKIQKDLTGANLELFNLLFRTGIRLGEVENYVLIVSQSNNNNLVNIKPKKSNNERLLPKVPIDKLQNIKLNTNALKHRIQRWGFNMSAHDLRATFITRLIKKGIDIHKVQMLVGHKKIESTIAYSRLSNEHDMYLYGIAQEDVLEYGTRHKYELIKRITELEKQNIELINLNEQLIKNIK
ncbi:MAG: site-specific integrase [Mollicutes bacterium PWAP]|nr:site-specific integrase [Mollicutes bacterium PWAP]